jgi:hypothetical protein
LDEAEASLDHARLTGDRQLDVIKRYERFKKTDLIATVLTSGKGESLSHGDPNRSELNCIWRDIPEAGWNVPVIRGKKRHNGLRSNGSS